MAARFGRPMDVRAFLRNSLEHVLDTRSVSRLRRQMAVHPVPRMREVLTA